MTEQPPLEVRPSVQRVIDPSGQGVVRDRVDREVPALGRGLHAHGRIRVDDKVPVTFPHLPFPPRQGDVYREASQLGDGECSPHLVDPQAEASQHAVQGLGCQSERLQVELAKLAAEQGVPNAASDQAHGTASAAAARQISSTLGQAGFRSKPEPGSRTTALLFYGPLPAARDPPLEIRY